MLCSLFKLSVARTANEVVHALGKCWGKFYVLFSGLLALSQSVFENSVTRHIDTGFLGFPRLQANAARVPKIQLAYPIDCNQN
jgi:hypothetical protein